MLIGIGVDIVSLAKMGRLWQRHGSRVEEEFLTPRERTRLAELKQNAAGSADDAAQRRISYLASRFAAKEAAVKALNWPHRVAYDWNDIEVSGETRITIELHGRLSNLANTTECIRMTGSVASSGTICIAVVMGETV